MPRQRIRVDGSSLVSAVSRGLVVLLGAALVYYGVMLVMLALKVSPSTVNDLCGYRTAFNWLAGLNAADISGSDRLIVALIGLAAALIAALLVWRGLPRPHLARHSLTLAETEHGHTEVEPRAIERSVEAAALEHAAIAGARARYDDGTLALAVTADNPVGLVTTLREVEESAHESLATHELDLGRVDVTLAGYSSTNGRNLG